MLSLLDIVLILSKSINDVEKASDFSNGCQKVAKQCIPWKIYYILHKNKPFYKKKRLFPG